MWVREPGPGRARGAVATPRARKVVPLACALVLVAVSCLLGTGVRSAAAAQPNPPAPRECASDVTLMLDASGSVATAGARPAMRRGALAMLAALDGTAGTARITQFATFSEELAPRTTVDGHALAADGPLGEAVGRYLDPEPLRPAGVHVHRYRGGSTSDPDSFVPADAATRNTNWDAAFEQAVEPGADLVVMVTDGREPTAYDLDAPGDPFVAGPPPDVAVETQLGAAADVSMDRSVAAADRVKQHARVLVVGVGLSPSDSASRARLAAVSGPRTLVHPDPGQPPPLDEVDIALLADYDDVGPFLDSVVRGLCRSALSVRAVADGIEGGYGPLAGQAVTVAPDVPGGVDWIRPRNAAGPEATVVGDDSGRSRFQWSTRSAGPVPTEVTAPLPDAYAAGRPDEPDYTCRVTHPSGDVDVVEGEFAGASGLPQFVVTAEPADVVTCDYFLTYDPRPALGVTVAATPSALRGDLDPPALATVSIALRNTGNVALSHVEVTTGACGGASRDAGAVAAAADDGRLEPGQTWAYTCRQPVRAADTRRPAPEVPVVVSAQAVDDTGRRSAPRR